MSIIKSIIQHDLRRLIANHKIWYCLAVLQTMLAVIFNWLINSFLKLQINSKGLHYGITEEVLHPFYASFSLMVLLVLPMFAVQTICAEKQQGTMLNFYCAPIKLSKLMLAKFCSGSIVLLLLLSWISCMPLTIIKPNLLDWGQFFSILCGVYLMLNTALAICLGLATYMQNVSRANVLIFLALLTAILLEWAAHYMGRYGIFMQMFSLLYPLKPFLAGIINPRAIAVYLLMIIGFLSIGSMRLEQRRQHG